jgi:hypothetical protein
VEEALTFGNHKGAMTKPDLLKLLVNNDVIHGFALPLPLDKIIRVQGILLAPLNIQTQNTIDDMGRIVPKDRLAHNQSYKWSYSGTSVNSRVDKNKLLPCVYGGAIRRLVNWAVAARNKYPNTRIYVSKIDFKAAYRRLHLHHLTAVQSCTQIPDLEIGLLPLRLTFGGAPCPYEWGKISETICNLATAIIQNDAWDPDNLQAPNQEKFLPPKFMADDVPFGEGRELVINVEVDSRRTHDTYIDDLIGLGLDLPGTDNLKRSEGAPLLAIDAYSRQRTPVKPIPRHNMAARHKLWAEGLLEEAQMILGWRWDFRRLIISLPINKCTAWTEGINKMIKNKNLTAIILETTIGRLTHVSMIIPAVHHFLSRLRELHFQAKNNNQRLTNIPQICIDDLELMKKFLKWGHEGISMNQIAYRNQLTFISLTRVLEDWGGTVTKDLRGVITYLKISNFARQTTS